jgi:hypothetical protein
MLINNNPLLQVVLWLFLFSHVNLYPQNGIINNIISEIGRDYIQIMYNLSGDTSSLYNVKFCIKDSTSSTFALFPNVIKGSVGIGKFAGRRNIITVSKSQLPKDILISKIYYEITAEEVIDENNFRDITKISQNSESFLNEGVAIIIGIEDMFDRTSSIQNSAQIFNDYCLKVFKIPFKQIRYEINKSANRANLESIFRKDGWLHNNITDGITDVIIYFAGVCVLNETGIQLLPSGSKSSADGFSLNELIPTLEGFNAKSVTIFIESFIQNEISNQTTSNHILYPSISLGNINILMASRGNQKNYNIEEENLSLFTYQILKGISGRADLDKNRTITFRELYEFVKKNVWTYSVNILGKEQDPILIPNIEDVGEHLDKVFLKLK